MQSKSEVLFIATYDSGHEEWLWMDAQIIRGGDHVAGAIAKQSHRPPSVSITDTHAVPLTSHQPWGSTIGSSLSGTLYCNQAVTCVAITMRSQPRSAAVAMMA
jgi:hypothetical protein